MTKLSPPCLLAALLLAAAGPALAVPAPPFALSLENADGTRVAARMLGDEHLSWFEDPQGFSMAFDEQAGAWRYARLGADGRLLPGPHRVGQIDPARAGLAPHLRPGPSVVRRALETRASAARALPPRSKVGPPQGVVRNLVLLVKFKNQLPNFTPADFEPVFNGETGSVREYYSEISDGKVDMVSTIVDWIPLPEDDLYYAYNDRHPFGVPWHMVRDAVRVLEAQGFDFTRFDADRDGHLDALDVIHSGPAYETTGNRAYIHSHFAPLGWDSIVTSDGITISAYHTEAEFGPDNRSPTQIGVIVHETGHFFGLPDLYDYGYDSGGLGLWCVMSGGAWAGPGGDGSRPTHPSAWAKYQLGFIVPERIEADSPGRRLAPTETTPAALLIQGDLPQKQYFLLENRQRLGYDAYLPGEGLLIFHVDESRNDNDDQDRYLVDLEQADGERDLNRQYWSHGDRTDPFPLGDNDAFTPVSNPASVAYGASAGSVFVTGITRSERDVLFDVAIRLPAELGEPCDAAAMCLSGTCADGVCCDESCEGPCNACSTAEGAPADGICALVSGRPCDDQNPCTVDDACLEGVCRGGQAKTCEPLSSCHEAGECVRETGRCTAPRKLDGAPCDDGDPCSGGESCAAGFCQPGTPLQCVQVDECHLAGVCDPAGGECSSPVAPDGSACSKGSCQSGVCTEKPVETRCGCSAGAGALPALSLLTGLALLRRRRRGRA